MVNSPKAVLSVIKYPREAYSRKMNRSRVQLDDECIVKTQERGLHLRLFDRGYSTTLAEDE